MNTSIIGLKELREHAEKYISEVKRGKSFIVVRRSKPIFKIAPPSEEDDLWESIIDFTKIKKNGIPLRDIIARL
jgi:prevent-host-death family protein